MKTQIKTIVYISIIAILAIWSCKKEDPIPAKSSEKAISSFTFNSLNPIVAGKIDGANITVAVPAQYDIAKLAPTVVTSDKTTITPESGTTQDFSKPVTYTVTAEDATTKTYTVVVTKEYPTNGLLAYYPFNGNAKDASGNGVDGNVNGAILTEDRNGGKTAYLFDGNSNNITFAKTLDTGTDNWTMSFWVKVTKLNQLGNFITLGYDDGIRGDGFAVGIGSSANMSAKGSFVNTTYNGLVSWPQFEMYESTNQWRYVVFMRENGISKFMWYEHKMSTPINSSSFTAYKNVNLIPFKPTSFTIGSGTTGGVNPRFFAGAIDDVRIYKRALTLDEIKLMAKE